MKNKLLLLLLGLSIFVFQFYQPSVVKAQEKEYIVKSYIVLPRNPSKQINDPAKIEQYKTLINQVTQEVHQTYARLLNGKTFRYSTEVQLLETSSPLTQLMSLFRGLPEDEFDNYNKKLPLPLVSGEVDVFWVLGTNDGPRIGGYPILMPDSGFAMMRHQDLLNLQGANRNDINFTKYALAHELGHAFGLLRHGYAKGHPCTSDSPQECTENAPLPYAGGREWESMMGYGEQYRPLSEKFFNNSTYNPEIHALYNSPFINLERDPYPPEVPPAPDYKKFNTGLNKPITAGEGFGFVTTNFGAQRGEIFFVDRPFNQLATKLPESAYEVRRWDEGGLDIRIKPDGVSPYSSSKWRMQVKKATGEILESEDEVTINGVSFGRNPELKAIVQVKVTCDSDNKPLRDVIVGLIQDGHAITGGYMTNINGETILTYVRADISQDIRFKVKIAPFNAPEMIGDQEYTIRGGAPREEGVVETFHLNQCPEGSKFPKLEANRTINSEVSKLYISNYSDFRSSNVPNDIGSQTLVVDDPQRDQRVEWGLSSLNKLKYIYVREIYANGLTRDYTAQLDENKFTKVGKVEIAANHRKNITKMTVNGQEINLSSPQGIKIKLADVPNGVPVQITYSDGDVRSFAWKINHDPNVGGGTTQPNQPAQPALANPSPVTINAPVPGTQWTGYGVSSNCNGQPCKAVNLRAECTNGRAAFYWTRMDGSPIYQIRVDDTSTSWFDGATDYINDTLTNGAGYQGPDKPLFEIMPVKTGQRFKWWVHIKTDKGTSEAVNGSDLQCGSLSSSDTSAPKANPALSASCNRYGDKSVLAFEWNSTKFPGAVKYAIRVNMDPPDDRGANYTPGQNGDLIDDNLTNSYKIAYGQYQHLYSWWMHPVYADGRMGEAVTGPDIRCENNIEKCTDVASGRNLCNASSSCGNNKFNAENFTCAAFESYRSNGNRCVEAANCYVK